MIYSVALKIPARRNVRNVGNKTECQGPMVANIVQLYITYPNIQNIISGSEIEGC